MSTFTPWPPLIEGRAAPQCRACVIVPARNEADSLGTTLDRLAAQKTATGETLHADSYEVLLLLNNCTDDSFTVARNAADQHPTMRLHLVERTLPEPIAHVGTARRLLMDTAWHRLREHAPSSAILSTDADTLVATDWISQNLRALANGADAVGGEICWLNGELARLPPQVQFAYARDQRYQRLLAELEHRLDPRAEDPMPRHLHHFGASLACTSKMYAQAGGLPALRSLEDVALVNALERSGARIRHEPRVRVYTSGRLEGRVEVGLSGQLRTWQQMGAAGETHIVSSAAWSVHRLRTLRLLRCFAQHPRSVPVTVFPHAWSARLIEVRQRAAHCAEFLDLLPAEALIAETFAGEPAGEILSVLHDLESILRVPRTRNRSGVATVLKPQQGPERSLLAATSKLS